MIQNILYFVQTFVFLVLKLKALKFATIPIYIAHCLHIKLKKLFHL